MTVAIKRVGTNVAEAVAAAMDLARFRDYVPPASTVFLKVNLGWDLAIPGSVTNPAVFEAVVLALRGYAGRIYVVESDQVLENVERAYAKSQISQIARRHGVPWINLSREKRVLRPIPGNRVLRDVPVPEILTSGILLTLPVMKTHNKSTVTLSLKNQWGCIPKMRHMYHLVLDEAIVDVNAAIAPKFAVVDGTIAMDGNAPKTGRPREVGIVGAGADLVEIDSVFAHIMGFNPRAIGHIVEAERRGLGTIGMSWLGDRPIVLPPFRPAGHNIVSRWEILFRRSAAAPWVFRPPVFQMMLLGAKAYYYAFEARTGRRLRAVYRNHPLYGRYYERPQRTRIK